MSRCTGCKKLKEDEEVRSCLHCGHPGPYCDNCRKCVLCNEDYPGNRTCGDGRGPHLTRGGFRTKCIDCDEFDYCAKCVDQCPCGQGERPHYLCKEMSDEHDCNYYNEEIGRGCKTNVCKRHCGIVDLNGKTRVYCPQHRPTISASLRDAVVRYIREEESAEYKKRLREEL